MKRLIWDLPTRVSHWALAAAVLLAYFIPPRVASGSMLSGLHVVCGVTAALLLVSKLLWGLVGTKHARFRSLLFTPAEVTRYVASAVRGQGPYFAGHNPASALVICVAFVLLASTVASGLLMNSGGRVWEPVHEVAPNLLIALVAIHIVGVLLATFRHKENYVASMFSGMKTAGPEDAIPRSHPAAAVVMAASVVLAASYFAGGFQPATGVFSPPGTSISVQLTEPARERRPRQMREGAAREGADGEEAGERRERGERGEGERR